MPIAPRTARFIVAGLIALLFIGTLMPGGWKDAAARPFHSFVDVAMLAHVALFAGICCMAVPAKLWRVKPWHVPLVGLALAFVTEGLQFFAIDRHPNLAGVAQDMIGAFVGWAGARFAVVPVVDA